MRVINNDLDQLINQWRLIVDEYVSVESNMDEWLNDMDTRHMIESIVSHPSNTPSFEHIASLQKLDKKIKSKTIEIQECIWGEKYEIEHKINKVNHWYYYIVNDLIIKDNMERFRSLPK